jgi:hypothetical protein
MHIAKFLHLSQEGEKHSRNDEEIQATEHYSQKYLRDDE